MQAENTSNEEMYLVGEIPEELHADDGAAADELQRIIAHEHSDMAKMIKGFTRTERHAVKLSTLQKEYEKNQQKRALMRLMRRQRVEIDDRYLHDVSNADLAWAANEHFIDMMVIVTDKPGLHALLPQNDTDPSYVFKLDLHQRHRTWKAKHVDLGFDPAGRMLYIGTYNQEEIWLAMVPTAFIRAERTAAAKHIDAPNSALTQRHFCMITTFLAHQLHEGGYKDIQIRTAYPLELTQADMRQHTNIFGHGLIDREIHELTYREVKDLHTRMVARYEDFASEAPEGWLGDGYLRDNVPITIAVRYGQNQEICRFDRIDEEADHWNRLHRYKCVRTMDVALATHVKCVPVTGWEDVDVGAIMRDNVEGIYDSPSEDDRQLVNLRDYPLLDDNGHEMNVYDWRGHRIPRRHALIDDGISTAGMLFRLRNLHEVFEDRLFDGGGDSDLGIDSTAHFLYPIGCLGNIGQFQANGVMNCFLPLVRSINDRLAVDDDDDDDDDDDIDLDASTRAHVTRVISPVSSQGYNAYVHRIRARSRFHDVQRGMMTAAFLGTHVSGQANLNKAHDLRRLCDIALPFDRYHEKIVGADFDQSLRVENVFTIQVGRLRRAERTGRYIFKNIIHPLSRMTSHPTVLQVIKRHVVVFRQDVLPSIVEWTTFGLCTALRVLWSMHQLNLENGIPVPPYCVELTAALERALNFSHTGNPKVLSKGLMDPLWLSLSCMSDGMPCVSPIVSLETSEHLTLRVRRSEWPVSTRTAYPEVCSRRSMLLNFGLPHFNAYHAIFHVKHGICNLPDMFESHITDRSTRLALYIITLAVRVYETDVRTLVQSGMNASLGDVGQGPDADDHEVAIRLERTQALEAWSNIKDKILGYECRAHTHLVRAVVSDPRNLIDGLPKSVHSPKSIQWFAREMISASASGAAHPRAPFISGGGALPVMRVALSEAKCQLGITNMDSEANVLDLLVRVLNKRHVMNVPWSRNPTPGPGRPPSTVVYDSWVNLGSRHPHGASEPLIVGPSQRRIADATQSSTIASEKDCRAPWSVNDLSIQELHRMLDRSTLPVEWSLQLISLPNSDSYVTKTYEWVRDNYDGSKPVHQTALIVAIIFAAVLPNILHDSTPSHLRSVTTPEAITHAVRSSPWCPPPPGRKGFTSSHHFVTMMSTFIIAMYEPTSPLRIYMNEHQGNMGAPWTSKHGAKGIKPFNLVRMGLATAHGINIYTSPKYGMSWRVLTSSEIINYHSHLLRQLRDQPYGPHSALVFVVGETMANNLARTNQVKGRGLTRKSESSVEAGSSKRPRLV
ncbi:hypothetical protein EDD15DRAFT_2362477 [Pisolithus albus]|nr:hypothetical protein EDD15DRAFT_2362477 [Pisolithus albus]